MKILLFFKKCWFCGDHQVVFYSREDVRLGADIGRDQVSAMIPHCFQERYLRLYSRVREWHNAISNLSPGMSISDRLRRFLQVTRTSSR